MAKLNTWSLGEMKTLTIAFFCLFFITKAYAEQEVEQEKVRQNNVPEVDEAEGNSDPFGIFSAASCHELAERITKKHTPDFSQCYKSQAVTNQCDEFEGSLVGKNQDSTVLVVLDASGSMVGEIGGEQKIDIAKNVVRNFASGLSKGTQFGLLVYGHHGSNQEKDKPLSCEKSEMLFGFGEFQASKFDAVLDGFDATGWTSIAGAINTAENLLAGIEGSKSLYIVSDGIETCGGDPISAMKTLKENDKAIQTEVNIIGFDVDNETQAQLKAIAAAGKGSYFAADDADKLRKEFDKEKERLIDEAIKRRNCILDGAIEKASVNNAIEKDQRACLVEKIETRREASHEEYERLKNSKQIELSCANWLIEQRFRSARNKDWIKATNDAAFNMMDIQGELHKSHIEVEKEHKENINKINGE
ncbi:vWA domain-containing protein [Ostreibacterium oceani]|nr:VWA domain-containing protein [Ostreibacterium oceani]